MTCPLIRQHPVLVAQAAATVAAMMPGRFFLVLGTGENLNEHVTGARWPAPDERGDAGGGDPADPPALSGEMVTFRGHHYSADRAKLSTLPPAPPRLLVAARRPRAAQVAGAHGDGFTNTAPIAAAVRASSGI